MEIILEEGRLIVHQLVEQSYERGQREVRVACGASIDPDRLGDPHPQWSGWASDVNCLACFLR